MLLDGFNMVLDGFSTPLDGFNILGVGSMKI